NEIVVEPLFLCDAAELVGNAGGNDGGGSGGGAVMKEKRAGGQANDTENTVEGLGKHALNFAADEAGGGEIEVGQGEHVALDAALLFLVNGHDQEHGDKGRRNRGDGTCRLGDHFGSEVQDVKGKKDEAPGGEGNTKESIGESFVMLAFPPEEEADINVDEGGGDVGGKGQELQCVGGGPDRENHRGGDGGNDPQLLASIELRAEEEADTSKSEEGVIERGQQRIFADPGRETRAEIVQTVEDPGSGPIEKIGLALEGIDVGEEHSDEESSDQEAERDDTLNHRRA